MDITREVDYAVRCIVCLSSQPDKVKRASSIAQEMDIPAPFVSKILQKLSKKGFVTPIRGVKGGFRLAKRPQDISLLEVVEAIDGPIPVNICVIDSKSCNRIKKCTVHPVWVRIQKLIRKELGSVSFKKLVSEAG
ncbi:MAG: Rrf2 family transcriptional regulator [Thermodesulfovibrionales bacterium]|nr:Rrf2 family transcriptional regulator [Thermodesulfovibrionales bacterium]